MNTTVLDAVSAAAFAAAAVFALLIPDRRRGPLRRGISWTMAAAMGLYAFVGLSNLLEHSGVTTLLDTFEDYAEVLFFPLVGYAVYALRLSLQLEETEQTARVLAAEHEMLLRIVDTTPEGIVVVDDRGSVTFANDRARALLGLEDDPETGDVLRPQWRCIEPSADEDEGVFACALTAQPVRDQRCVLRAPSGARLSLEVSSTPVLDRADAPAGAVVAFHEVRDLSATTRSA